MTEPYLILHKVRGEPAFDVAIRCEDMGTPSDPGPWWIIPTSGHRAFPLDTTPLRVSGEQLMLEPEGENWDTLPDHYSAQASPRPPKITEALAGLFKASPFNRRKI